MPSTKKSPEKIPLETIVLSKEEINKHKERMLKCGDSTVGRTINHMIQSRFRILYVRSHEERRVVEFFRSLSTFRGMELFHWDCDRGLLDANTKTQVTCGDSEVHESPLAVLSHIVDHASKQSPKLRDAKRPTGCIYLLLDFHTFLDEDRGLIPQVERKLREFSGTASVCTLVIIAPNFVCPSTLEKEITLIDFPTPSYDEIKEALGKIVREITPKMPHAAKEARNNEEDLIKAVSGLTVTEAENAYAMSVVRDNGFKVETILEEKKQMVRKGGILEYRDPQFTLDQVGGLDTLKEWTQLRRVAFKNDAREYGLPMPKGMLLLGIPGVGKSMVCDAIAHSYKMPLLRLDFGAIFGSLVGESESNLRECLRLAEAVAPAILWIDEVEKGVGNVSGSSDTDSGVTARVFGSLLTWMQDRSAPVFMVCTANNITGIPPEFIRPGRFDETFFLDLPNDDQRAEVVQKLLSRKKRNPDDFDIDKIVSATPNYTPVEIEKAIDNGLFMSYSDKKRKLNTEDVVSAAKDFIPLYNSRREEVDKMRIWALGENGVGGRAVLANSKCKSEPVGEIIEPPRGLDLDL